MEIVYDKIEKTCPYCNCKFTFNQNEIAYIPSNMNFVLPSNPNDKTPVTRCPNCNEIVILDKADFNKTSTQSQLQNKLLLDCLERIATELSNINNTLSTFTTTQITNHMLSDLDFDEENCYDNDYYEELIEDKVKEFKKGYNSIEKRITPILKQKQEKDK